jgi:iron complex transport system ATP-binding protein
MDNHSQNGSLRTDHIQAGYNGHAVLDDLSLDIHQGSGKSTLLKTMGRLLRPRAGNVYLDGKLVSKLSTREVARRMAILPQYQTTPPGLTVRELVEQGRYAHSGPLRMLQQQDHESIDRALALTRTMAFADRPVESLSGGERQRVWIALILAQDTPILLLDEPTTFLDIGHQLEVLELVERLNKEQQLTIVLVLHDLNHAARYAHRMIVLNEGTVIADGTPTDVLKVDLLADIFRVRAKVTIDEDYQVPVFMPTATI